MVDTTTPLLGLLLMGTGGDNNTWGVNLNNSVITPVENAIANVNQISTITGGAYTLTQANSAYAMVFFSGALTADAVITVPSLAKKWTFFNGCTGNFSVLIKCAATAAVQLPYGKFTDAVCDSATVFRLDRERVGELFYHAGTFAPNGAFECQGQSLLRASFPDLFNAISGTWGAVDGTHFSLPDGYTAGKFLRARTASVASGTSQANQNKSHTHTGSGTTSAMSANATHNHTGSGTTSGVSAFHTHTGSGNTGAMSANAAHQHTGTTDFVSNDHSHTGSGTTSGMSANAAHAHSVSNGTLAGNTNVTLQSGGTYTGAVYAGNNTITINATNTDHTHTYSFTTSGISANHTHTFTSNFTNTDHVHFYSFTTSGDSVDHSHTYSFTTTTVNIDHNHTYSFTTSTGSADGTEARPESLVGILCIRY